MNLLSAQTIKYLLSKYGTTPLKQLGQNFLIDKNILDKIIEAAQIKKADTILEIGPGLGTLTQELAKKAKRVIAIEKGRNMIQILKETLRDYGNAEIIEGDALKFPITSLFVIPVKTGIQDNEQIPAFAGTTSGSRFKPGMTKVYNYKLVANLPYYITSPVIRKFLESNNPPSEMILMVQKEVAQRICAEPPEMSLLAVSVQFYAQPKILHYVSKSCFWPQPKVDSAIIKIIPKSHLPLYKRGIKGDFVEKENPPQPSFKKEGASDFFKVVRAGFSAPRKQLAGNLTKGLKINRKIVEEALKKAGISPSQRAETLRAEDWTRITKELNLNNQ
ncbi:MAG: 16S rRNA (adenine(1518)-N(6)/adenine(1519)-N(6))-dimethyltransferase [Candidatus Portnoybacteria bacterium]|nr:16S rRNA (adenine(1518)-N(6)/adenine(1519)-N(6))-dimethyltransferase [Candidatus Portnoybacteria bacterium]